MDNMENEVVALIPVREGSRRVKNKNFRPFIDSKSLLELKIGQLKKAGCFSHIYISSDSGKAERIALDNGVEFLKRDSKFCQSAPRWHEVVEHIVDTVPGNPLVAWTLTTAPTFERYAEAVEVFKERRGEYDSLVGVRPWQEYMLDSKGRPVGWGFGDKFLYSDELELHYTIPGSIYLAAKSDQLKWKFWIGKKPYLFEVTKFESVDVDTPQDFKFGQMISAYLRDNPDFVSKQEVV